MQEKVKILHLEDVPADAELVARELKKSKIDFEHLVIDSEQDYIAALDSFFPDLILCDHSLPAFNSLEALRLAKRKNLKVPFILITATMSEEVAAEVVNEGADDYILKDRIKRLPYAVLNAIEKYKYEQERKALLDEVHKKELLAKKALTEIANKLAMATKASGVGVWEYLIWEDLVVWDDRMFAIYGLPLGTFVNFDTWKNILHPDDSENLINELKSLIISGSNYNAEYRIKHKDGAYKIISAHAVVERDPSGKAIRMVGTNQDITAERNAATRLKESEAKFKAFFENSMDGIVLTEPDGEILEANTAACELFGMTQEELIRAGRLGVVDTTGTAVAKHIEQRRSTGKAFSELTLIRKDGSRFPGEVSSNTFYDTYGELRTTIVVRDISARKMAEQTLFNITNDLQHTVNSLNNILESSIDIICTIDGEGKFVTVSAAAEQIWGYAKEEVEGKNYIDFVCVEDRENTLKVASGIISGTPVRMFENRYRKKDGNIVPMLWSAKWDENHQLMYCIAKDATEKKRLEKAYEIERQRFLGLYHQAPSCMGILKGPNHIFELANPLYLELIGKKDIIGKKALEVLPELVDQGFQELVDHVYNTGETFSANEILARMDVHGTGQLVDKYLNLIYQANRNSDGEIDGILFFAVDVTEQVLSRKKIEENEKKYRQIVETAQEGIWLVNENNVTTFTNEKMAQILSYSREEMQGMHLFSFMDEEWARHAAEAMKSREEGHAGSMEFKFKSKSGKDVWTNISNNPIFEDGKYMGALGMVTDITEKRKLEKRLDEATRLARIGNWELDVESDTLFWSDVTKEIHEVASDFIPKLDTAINFYKQGSSRDSALLAIQQAINNGIPWNLPLQIVTAQGNERWVRVLGEAEVVNGKCIRLYGSFQDIDEIKKAELGLLKAYKEKNIILESIGDGFFAVDKQWTITYWNTKAEILLNKKKEEIIGQNLWHIFAEVVDSLTYKEYHKAIQSGEPVHFEDYFPFFSMWCEVSAYPSESGLSVYFKDITQRKNSVLELQQLHHNLQKYARNLAISNKELEQFAYGASHDLQEPLRMVTNFLTQIERKYNNILDARGKKYIYYAVDGAKRMRQIILDLLQFSRVGRIEEDIEQIDTNEVLKEVLYTFKRQINSSKIIIKNESLPVIPTYRTLLLLVFQNLISNALKYQPKDHIPVVEISCEETTDHWQFQVKDNGIGIESEYVEQIFTVFQRLHNKDDYSGTGMGLAICKRIIENLNGSIWVTSVPAKGSSFFFTLPKQITLNHEEDKSFLIDIESQEL